MSLFNLRLSDFMDDKKSKVLLKVCDGGRHEAKYDPLFTPGHVHSV